MTEKRYSHDAIVIVDHLKKDLIYIDGKDELLELAEYVDRLQEENKELKKELAKFKEWEKYVGHVKREELDRVFKMSIYEIAESFEYYKKRIETLEKELEE